MAYDSEQRSRPALAENPVRNGLRGQTHDTGALAIALQFRCLAAITSCAEVMAALCRRATEQMPPRSPEPGLSTTGRIGVHVVHLLYLAVLHWGMAAS